MTPLRRLRSASSHVLRALASLALAAGCVGAAAAGEVDDGFVDSGAWAARQLEYLEFSTEVPLSISSPLHAITYMERERVDETFSTTPGAVPATAWDARFDKLWRLRDTSDFDLVYMLNARYGYPDHPMIDPGLWDALDAALLSFKYWYTDPTPERIVDEEQVVDDMFYWTENHTLLFHTNELLAGKLHPDTVFSVSGMTGAEHVARAREGILRWLEERSRWGFVEWHSNVYYNLTMIPLLTLIEHSGDEEIVEGAEKVLDLLMFDVALHLHRGTFGATHGRSYAKDKASADTEDTFGWSKMLFDDTALPYRSRGGSGSSLMARAQKYRLPEVIRRIARSETPLLDRQRMNLAVDERPPDDPYETPPQAPYGLDFTDETRLPLWWSMGLLTTWVGLPLTFDVADRENLWITDTFQPFIPLRDIVYAHSEDWVERLAYANQILGGLHPYVGFAVLKEANTYTYRTPSYMLSTVQDYRKGFRAAQIHSWQATLSERAMVFTSHPGLIPLPEDNTEVPKTWNWQSSDEPGPGYWTGEAAMPRSAQHENVGIHLYDPLYDPQPLLGFLYRNETHAYFPHAHFDEVVQEGSWTFGRKDDGYVALYSYWPTAWRSGQPELFENDSQPFDLVAAGHKDNVWIVECGDDAQWGDFATFRQAIGAAAVSVTPLEQGFDVSYGSPSQGTMQFGWEGPLLVGGASQPIADYRRHDNAYATTEFDATHYEISDGSYGLILDFDQNLRVAVVPEPGATSLGLAAIAGLLACARVRRRR